jgi:hypothetical protein
MGSFGWKERSHSLRRRNLAKAHVVGSVARLLCLGDLSPHQVAV